MDCKLSHKIGFYQRIVGIVIGRRADLIVSALDPRSSGPGARFSKLPIITGPVKLCCFPYQMGVSKGSEIVQ